MKHTKTTSHIITLVLLTCFVACGGTSTSGIGTGVSNPPTATEASAAAVSAIFSTQSGQSSVSAQASSYLLKKIIPLAQAQQRSECSPTDPYCTCEEDDEGPQNITMGYFGSAGMFGSDLNSITVTEEHYCKLSDGTINVSHGPDDNGRFATFIMEEDVPMSCDDGSSISMDTGSIGIWRNLEATDPADENFNTEIFGSFNFSVDGSTFTVNCSLLISGDNVINTATCTDESGTEIEQTTSTTCQILVSN